MPPERAATPSIGHVKARFRVRYPSVEDVPRAQSPDQDIVGRRGSEVELTQLLGLGSLAVVIRHLIDRAFFSLISASSRPPMIRCGSCLRFSTAMISSQASLMPLVESGHQRPARRRMLHRKQSLGRLRRMEGLPHRSGLTKKMKRTLLDFRIGRLDDQDQPKDEFQPDAIKARIGRNRFLDRAHRLNTIPAVLGSRNFRLAGQESGSGARLQRPADVRADKRKAAAPGGRGGDLRESSWKGSLPTAAAWRRSCRAGSSERDLERYHPIPCSSFPRPRDRRRSEDRRSSQ